MSSRSSPSASLLGGEDLSLARAVSALVYGNPFLPERIEAERAALGSDFVPEGTLWHRARGTERAPNIARLHARVESLVERVRERGANGGRATPTEVALYEDLVLYLLFSRYEDDFFRLVEERGAATGRVGVYRRFVRDLERYLAEMDGGRFRADLYYRLCSDLIETPALVTQLQDTPAELRTLLAHLAERIAGEAEAETLAGETHGWIERHLPPRYPWPGNVRELEQCVRNVMIRGEYRPPRTGGSAASSVAAGVVQGTLTADELLRRYCTLVYAQTGSYQETARRLALDRRTVRDKIDRSLLERLQAEGVRPASS